MEDSEEIASEPPAFMTRSRTRNRSMSYNFHSQDRHNDNEASNNNNESVSSPPPRPPPPQLFVQYLEEPRRKVIINGMHYKYQFVILCGILLLLLPLLPLHIFRMDITVEGHEKVIRLRKTYLCGKLRNPQKCQA